MILAELCVGETEPETLADRIESWGVICLPLTAGVAAPAALAFSRHLAARRESSPPTASRVPLPDFLIGAHAAILDVPLATADEGRSRTYFPQVRLLTP